jgi:hypothetical protein
MLFLITDSRGIGATIRSNLYLYGGLLLIAGTVLVVAEGTKQVAKRV